MEHKDLLGYYLHEGDHVVYPTGHGSDKRMCVAQIVEIVDFKAQWLKWDPETRKSEMTYRDKWKVRLQPKIYNDGRGSYGYTEVDGVKKYGKLDREPKQVTVERVENLVKVVVPHG